MNSTSEDEGISKRAESFRSPSRSAKLTRNGSSRSGQREVSGAEVDEHASTWDGREGEGEGEKERGDEGVSKGVKGEETGFGEGDVVDKEEWTSEEAGSGLRSPVPSSDMNIWISRSVLGSEVSAPGG